MAYETGTAENERELIQKIDTFLTSHPQLKKQGQTWQRLHQHTFPANYETLARYQYVWKSDNTGGDKEIFLAAVSWNNIVQDRCHLELWGGTFFNEDFATIENLNLGMTNPSPKVSLISHNRTFTYHIVGDGRKVMIFTELGETTSSFYGGFILPLVPPTEYPYPFCIAGSGPEGKSDRHSLRNQYYSSIIAPRDHNCFLLTPDQTWRDFYSDNYHASGDGNHQFLFPTQNKDPSEPSELRFMFSSLTAIGCTPLIPVEFISYPGSTQGANRWGAYEDLYWTPGIGRQRGDRVELADGRVGLVLNNAYNNDTTDYFVVIVGEKSHLEQV